MTARSTHLGTVKRILDTGRTYEIRQPSQYVNLTVKLGYDSEEITFKKGNDGKWRYAYHSTYGNGSFINGEGCDASGYVVTDKDSIRRLEAIVTKGYNA